MASCQGKRVCNNVQQFTSCSLILWLRNNLKKLWLATVTDVIVSHVTMTYLLCSSHLLTNSVQQYREFNSSRVADRSNRLPISCLYTNDTLVIIFNCFQIDLLLSRNRKATQSRERSQNRRKCYCNSLARNFLGSFGRTGGPPNPQKYLPTSLNWQPYLHLLTPKSDLHQISPYNITPYSNGKVRKIKVISTKRSVWRRVKRIIYTFSQA